MSAIQYSLYSVWISKLKSTILFYYANYALSMDIGKQEMNIIRNAVKDYNLMNGALSAVLRYEDDISFFFFQEVMLWPTCDRAVNSSKFSL